MWQMLWCFLAMNYSVIQMSAVDEKLMTNL